MKLFLKIYSFAIAHFLFVAFVILLPSFLSVTAFSSKDDDISLKLFNYIYFQLPRICFLAFLLTAVISFRERENRKGVIPALFLTYYLLLLVFYLVAKNWVDVNQYISSVVFQQHWIERVYFNFDCAMVLHLNSLAHTNPFLFALYLFSLMTYFMTFVRAVPFFEWRQLNLLFATVLFLVSSLLFISVSETFSSYIMENIAFVKKDYWVDIFIFVVVGGLINTIEVIGYKRRGAIE